MSLVSALFFGLMQGLTEFLPVSSSGHLALLHAAFGTQEGTLAFDVFLHLSTLLAVLIVCRRECMEVLSGLGLLLFRPFGRRGEALTAEERLVIALLLSTLPMALALVLSPLLDRMHASVRAVALLLIGNGIILALGQYVCGRRSKKETETVSFPVAIAIGLGQVLAVFPGISRSGMTVTVARLSRIEQKTALRYSFLLSIPTVLGANAVKLPALLTAGVGMAPSVLIGASLAAFLGALMAMKALTHLQTRSFLPFGVYTALLGIAALLLAA